MGGPADEGESKKMNKFVFAAIAAMALTAAAPAQHEGHTMSKPHVMAKDMPMTAMACCMQGLTPAEKKTAMGMMKKMTPAEHRAMMKRCSICMRDPHAALAKMDPKKITDAMVMQHMMSGVTNSEQAAMKSAMKKMTPAEHAVGHKLCENCCVYGMKHAPKPHMMMKRAG